jgi:hypothetical protein
MSTDKNRDALVRIAKTYIPGRSERNTGNLSRRTTKPARNQLDLMSWTSP